MSGCLRCHTGDPIDRLTRREREVLALMAEGRSNAGITEDLVLSESAVAKHINGIFTKLDIPPTGTGNRRVLAVLHYLRAERVNRPTGPGRRSPAPAEW